MIDIAGDGSFQMTIQELATAVDYGLAVKVCILNNQYLGMVRQWQELFWTKRYSATCVACQPDFVKLAEAYGAEGYRATRPDEVEDVLRVALASDAPAVIDFRVKREANVWPMVPAGGSIDQMMVEGTSMKHTLSVLVENKPGVLTRIAGTVRASRLQHRQPGGGRDRGSASLPHDHRRRRPRLALGAGDQAAAQADQRHQDHRSRPGDLAWSAN